MSDIRQTLIWVLKEIEEMETSNIDLEDVIHELKKRMRKELKNLDEYGE